MVQDMMDGIWAARLLLLSDHFMLLQGRSGVRGTKSGTAAEQQPLVERVEEEQRRGGGVGAMSCHRKALFRVS